MKCEGKHTIITEEKKTPKLMHHFKKCSASEYDRSKACSFVYHIFGVFLGHFGLDN